MVAAYLLNADRLLNSLQTRLGIDVYTCAHDQHYLF